VMQNRPLRICRRLSRLALKHVPQFTLRVCLCLISLGRGTLAPAQQLPPGSTFEGQPVVDIVLVARPSVDVDVYNSLVLQKVGDPYSDARVQKSVAALMATGLFNKVTTNVTPQHGGLELEFIMEPAYYLGILNFPGALGPFSYPRLMQVVKYTPEEPYEKGRVEQGRVALEKFVTHNGYFQAKVTAETQLDPARKLATVIYRVNLNKLARIGDIQLAGPPPQEIARLQSALGSLRARVTGAFLRKGQLYNADRIDSADRYLQSELGKQNYLASKIKLQPPQYEAQSNRASLHFDIEMGPTVQVRVTGARVSKKTLQRLIPIYQEATIDEDLINEGENNLVSYFQDRGFFDVAVTPDLTADPAKLILTYAVQQGRKHRVQSVKLAGNRRVLRQDLLGQLQIQQANYLSRGKFSQDRLKKSVDNLKAYYHNEGFADAKVTPKVVDSEPNIDVTFAINEGEQTIVDAFQVDGNTNQNLARLAPDGLQIERGKPYSQNKMDKDRNRIVATYLNLGYPNAAFKAAVSPTGGNAHRVAVAYSITEGPRVRVAQVIYVGQQVTQQPVIERAARIKPKDDMSEGKMLEGESRVYNTGVFDWADVSPRRPIIDQTVEDVLVRVHEAKRNSVTYGLGFESTPRSGSLSTGVLILPGLPTVGLPKGFAVLQKTIVTPVVSVDYSRLNMRGRAETGSVSFLFSTLDHRGGLNYSQPHMGGTNWNGLWSFSAESTTQNPLFTARLGEAAFQLERTLDTERTKRLQFRYSFKRTALSNLLIQNFVPAPDLSVQLSTFSGSFVRDTRDKPLDAHKGMFQTVDLGISPAAFGSTDSVARFFGETAYYRQMRPSLVWANNIRLGMVTSFGSGHVPFSERFFSGGASSLRGFSLNGAGPQATALLCTKVNDPTTCTAKVTVPTGGRQLFIFNSEARFPLPITLPIIQNGLGGVLFYDGGNVFQAIGMNHFIRDYSNTVGFGLRYKTPVGPIRIDLGRNLNPASGQKSFQLFVTVGQSF